MYFGKKRPWGKLCVSKEKEFGVHMHFPNVFQLLCQTSMLDGRTLKDEREVACSCRQINHPNYFSNFTRLPPLNFPLGDGKIDYAHHIDLFPQDT